MDNQNQLPQSTQSNSIPTNEPPNPYRRNWTRWLLVYFVIAILIYGGVYFVLSRKSSKPYSVNYPTPTIIVQPTTASDKTSNWKTYRNEKFGFKIKYPNGWTVIEGPEELTVFNKEKGEPFISIVSANRAVLGVSFCGAYRQSKRCEVIRPFIIDWGSNGKAVAETDVRDGTVALFITLHKVTSDSKELFRQILSTFRFVESKPVIPTDKVSCEAKGGKWDRFGLAQVWKCNLPTSDAGKICTDSSQCESACIADSPAKMGQKVTGKCYEWTEKFGCFTYVNDGKAFPICVD